MLKKLLAALLLPLVVGCSENDKNSANADKEIYTVATCADYPPFEFLKDGQIVGFDIDLVHALAKKMGIKITVNDMSFDAILGSLKSNRIDMAISSITPTPERKQAVDFSDEYYSTGRVFVCNDSSSIHSINDLTGLVVGVQAGSIHEVYSNGDLKNIVTGVTVKSLPRLPELVQDLKAGRINCICLGEKEAEVLVKNTPGLRLVAIEEGSLGCAIALPKGSKLREKINNALKQLNADGTIEKLQQKWLQK